MFIGLFGHSKKMKQKDIVSQCYDFAETFEKKFGSLQCSILRPEGFNEKNTPHMCENLTVEAIEFAIGYIDQFNDKYLNVLLKL